MSRGRLSPVPPPRAPSPGGSTKNSLARQASPISDVPRPSISSNRSMKRSEADFEAALLNPTKTIFLKGSPVLDEDEGFGSPRRLGVISGDVDAPVPVEKRSYEDDLRQLGRSSLDRGAGSSGTMVSNNIKGGQASFDVIPPTPSPKKTLVNRTSHRTMESQDSGTSTMSPSRMSQISASSSSKRIASQSLGIDAELNESQTMTGGSGKKGVSKRRSIFRSPGTASSPDLATLVRKAKEARTNGNTASNESANGNGHHQAGPKATGANGQTFHTRQSPAPPLPTSQSMGLGSSMVNVANGGSRGTISPSNHRTLSRTNRAASASVSGSEDGWDRFSDLKSLPSNSPEKMATISERPGTRSRESSNNSHEGSKSLRNKARGMFGRMFGASTSREHTPTTSPSLPTASRFASPESSRPPVPPVPDTYRQEADARRRVISPANDNAAISPSENDPPVTATMKTPLTEATPTVEPTDRFDSPNEPGRQSVTPTGRRRSETSPRLVDKPLPDSPVEPSLPPASSRSTPKFDTMHRRQPADAFDDESRYQNQRASPSPRRPVTMSFSDDVAGIFDTIGQSDPAKELGLPPESFRIRDRTKSGDISISRIRFPADLGRSTSNDNPRKDQKLVVPGPISLRTSSLPNGGSPRIDSGASLQQRSPSSPVPSSRPLEDSLVLPTSVSRSSSSSSRRRTKTDTGTYPSLVAPNLGSPLQIGEADFAPKSTGEDTTLRANREAELPPLSPASVRLVNSPQVSSIAGSGFSGRSGAHGAIATPWGRSSPAPRAPSTVTDNMEIVKTPIGSRRGQEDTDEDDEEKGRRLACEFLENDFSSVQADKVAEFLGGPRAVNAVALRYYMQYFDMKGQSLVDAFRDLCAKLHLRAESQEIDRIIEGFSARYYECNPTTVFGTPGVVHTVTGAMLMLNTDLHIADLVKHMSRADFVRNSLRAIQESMPSADPGASTPDLVRDDSGSVRLGSNPSLNQGLSRRPSHVTPLAHRSASAPVVQSVPPPTRQDSERSVSIAGDSLAEGKTRASSTTVSSFTYNKQWEVDAESALKDIYNQVRADRILLPIGDSAPTSNRQSIMSVGSDFRGSSMRSPSGKSNDRINALKRGSIRGMQGLMNNPYGPGYAGSDGRLSPTGSYATSIGDNMNSFSATIGFASNLSHTVIREQEDEKNSAASVASAETTDDDLNDDELALLGAPWAKEGMLWRRTGMEIGMRKTSKKEWKQFFAVVQKGEMLLFTFGQGSSGAMFGAVGGGNWLNNANAAGRYPLIHTSSVPLKGGYGKDKPYVFCMTLPTNEALYLAAGTDDLVTEWVNTCNYWSARRSRQPLQGGVSNMEYGWNRISDISLHGDGSNSPEDDKASIRSGRSNMSRFNTSTYGRRSFSTTPADRLYINDWKPPQPSMMPSPLEEEAQLDTLTGYVKTIKDDLEAHRLLEGPMVKLYSAHSKNSTKAHANWTARCKYLMAEQARYDIYVDALQEAIALRIKKQGERKLEKSLQRSMTSLHRRESEDAERVLEWSGDPGVKSGLRGRRDVRADLSVGTSEDYDDEEEADEDEVAKTPVAATRR